MRTIHIALVIAAAGLIAVASVAAQSPEPTPPPAEAVPDVSVPAAIPDEARQRKNPRAATPDSIANGEELYFRQCVSCHGPKGDGKGSMVAALDLKMPDYSKPNAAPKRTDGELFYIISQGHGRMPGGGGRLPENSRWDLVNFLRVLAAPSQPAGKRP